MDNGPRTRCPCLCLHLCSAHCSVRLLFLINIYFFISFQLRHSNIWAHSRLPQRTHTHIHSIGPFDVRLFFPFTMFFLLSFSVYICAILFSSVILKYHVWIALAAQLLVLCVRHTECGILFESMMIYCNTLEVPKQTHRVLCVRVCVCQFKQSSKLHEIKARLKLFMCIFFSSLSPFFTLFPLYCLLHERNKHFLCVKCLVFIKWIGKIFQCIEKISKLEI